MSVDVAARFNNRHDVHGGNNPETAISMRTFNLTKVFQVNRISSQVRLNNRGMDKVAVNNFNIQVPRGAIYGYLGPNGSGKTTTIKMLTGLLRPTRGIASICGHTICDDLQEAQRHIGYVPDAVRRFPSMHAVNFLVLFGGLSGVDRETAMKRGKDLLSWAGLDEPSTLTMRVNKWSAGMQGRLLLVQALLHEPDVLILDEPTANLDPIARSDMIKLFKQLAAQGQTFFLSSHDLPEVQELCTHIGFLTKGELVLEGTRENLRKTVNEATGGGTTTFTVMGENLTKIAKLVEKKLDAKILDVRVDAMTISTKRGILDVARALGEVTESNPEAKISNMVQELRLHGGQGLRWRFECR